MGRLKRTAPKAGYKTCKKNWQRGRETSQEPNKYISWEGGINPHQRRASPDIPGPCIRVDAPYTREDARPRNRKGLGEELISVYKKAWRYNLYQDYRGNGSYLYSSGVIQVIERLHRGGTLYKIVGAPYKDGAVL